MEVKIERWEEKWGIEVGSDVTFTVLRNRWCNLERCTLLDADIVGWRTEAIQCLQSMLDSLAPRHIHEEPIAAVISCIPHEIRTRAEEQQEKDAADRADQAKTLEKVNKLQDALARDEFLYLWGWPEEQKKLLPAEAARIDRLVAEIAVRKARIEKEAQEKKRLETETRAAEQETRAAEQKERAARRAAEEKKKAAARDEWVRTHGSENQRARHRRAMLPHDEIEGGMEETAFAFLCDRPQFERLTGGDIEAEETDETDDACIDLGHDACFSSSEMTVMSAAQFEAVTDIEAAAKKATVEASVVLREHVAACDRCDSTAVRYGINVRVQYGAYEFEREFAAPAT